MGSLWLNLTYFQWLIRLFEGARTIQLEIPESHVLSQASPGLGRFWGALADSPAFVLAGGAILGSGSGRWPAKSMIHVEKSIYYLEIQAADLRFGCLCPLVRAGPGNVARQDFQRHPCQQDNPDGGRAGDSRRAPQVSRKCIIFNTLYKNIGKPAGMVRALIILPRSSAFFEEFSRFDGGRC
ncbi:MAG: hypothetical protein VX871_08525 [Pseudomonadota bacterium]|nr:hypothetical protein [Pseudomonadota bacterium]